MPGGQLNNDPRHRRANDADRAELKAFACGARTPAEEIAEEAVRALARRRPARDAQLLVFREQETDALIGVAAAKPAQVGYLEGELIQVVSLTADHRGAKMPDGTSRVADAMLSALIADVESRRGPRRPHLFALISADNKPSRELFERLGFEKTLLSHPHFDVWIREGDPSD